MDREVSEKIIEVIGKILTLLGEKAKIKCALEGETIAVDIGCERTGQLIGRGGRILEALQHIVQRIVGRSFAGRDIESIIIDVDGYRRRREEELSQMARDIAERVSRSGKSELLKPMSAWERKIIHMAVKASENLESQSEDSDSGRSVRIRPKSRDCRRGLKEEQ
jgi:spoIIIJ-associated protein